MPVRRRPPLSPLAQNLLDAIGFVGTGTYLKSPSANRTLANNLAATLDSYNNNTLCP